MILNKSASLFAALAVLIYARAATLPPKNLTTAVATLKADFNATKAALNTEIALKTGAQSVTVDGTLPRFAGGSVTCFVDPATGDVVGLTLGSSAPLCSTAGTPRSFAVPADGYIAAIKVAVDKATGLVGEMAFVVKSNSSLLPTNVFTCGTRGGIGVDIMPKAAALAGVSATCKSAQSGRRLHQAAPALAIDPAALSVTATTVNAPGSTNPGAVNAATVPYMYVSDYNGGGRVFGCTGKGTATLTCAPAATGLATPAGMVVSGSYVYVTDYAAGSIKACAGAGTGSLTCGVAATGLTFPAALAVAGSYAYVADGHSNGGVSACTGVGTGTLSCSPVVGNLGIPAGIAVSGSYVYVTDRTSNVGDVYACSGAGTASLTCQIAFTTTTDVRGIAVSGSYAYVTDYSTGVILACQGAGQATFSSCNTAATGLGNPAGIAVSGSYAYVTSFNTGVVSACTGLGTNTLTCSPAATGLGGAWAVAT